MGEPSEYARRCKAIDLLRRGARFAAAATAVGRGQAWLAKWWARYRRAGRAGWGDDSPANMSWPPCTLIDGRSWLSWRVEWSSASRVRSGSPSWPRSTPCHADAAEARDPARHARCATPLGALLAVAGSQFSHRPAHLRNVRTGGMRELLHDVMANRSK